VATSLIVFTHAVAITGVNHTQKLYNFQRMKPNVIAELMQCLMNASVC